jgi:hypothetical protein
MPVGTVVDWSTTADSFSRAVACFVVERVQLAWSNTNNDLTFKSRDSTTMFDVIPLLMPVHSLCAFPSCSKCPSCPGLIQAPITSPMSIPGSLKHAGASCFSELVPLQEID